MYDSDKDTSLAAFFSLSLAKDCKTFWWEEEDSRGKIYRAVFPTSLFPARMREMDKRSV